MLPGDRSGPRARTPTDKVSAGFVDETLTLLPQVGRQWPTIDRTSVEWRARLLGFTSGLTSCLLVHSCCRGGLLEPSLPHYCYTLIVLLSNTRVLYLIVPLHIGAVILLHTNTTTSTTHNNSTTTTSTIHNTSITTTVTTSTII